MAITISGENNNDRILAADGVIDQISGINFSGIITASHINVGSNIQLGNAGIVTATTFIGNLTGNVNSTSPLLLQTGGSERFRITGNNELGIAGANYGSAGQVLTSGGSGSAVTWSAIPTQVTISNNATDRVITGGSGTNLNGEANLTFTGQTLTAHMSTADPAVFVGDSNRTGAGQHLAEFRGYWDGNHVARIVFRAGDDTTNKDDGVITMHTTPSGGGITERLRITSTGAIQFSGTNSADNTNKLVYLTTPSYDTDEEPFGFIHSGTYNNQNLLYLGGGMTSSYNACTLMKFYTTNSINTQVGTERLCIESWGGIQNNQGAIYGGGASNEPVVHFNGAAPANDPARGHLAVSDNRNYNQSPIARISLVTRYNSAGGYTFMGGIEGGKETTADSNYNGFVRIVTRTHGGTNLERLRIDSSGRVSLNDNSRPASDANEGAQFRVTGAPLTRNQYYSPAGHYYGSFGYTDNTYTKSWIAVDSSYAKSNAVSAGIFLSAFHQDANSSACGFTIKNLKDGNPLVFSSVVTAASVGNPAVETERFRITSDGKFSLGNTHATPSAAVHIDYDTNNMLMLDNSTSSTQKIFFAQNGGTHAQIYATSAQGSLIFDSDPGNAHGSSTIAFNIDGGEKLRIESGGEIRLTSENGNNSDTPGFTFRGGSSSQKANFARIHSRMVSNWGGQLQFKVKDDNGSLSDAYQTAMIMDHNAVIRMPNQCGFHMVHDGNQSLSSGDMVTNWDTDASSGKSYIKNCSFNSGRFVAPVDGLYFFTAQLLLMQVATNDDSIHLVWTTGSGNNFFSYWNTRHDGSAAHGSYGYGTYLPVTGSTTVYLSAGDIFGIKCTFSGAIAVYGTDSNWGHWSGYLVG